MTATDRDNARAELETLQDEYRFQPPVAQWGDLERINALREALGFRPVTHRRLMGYPEAIVAPKAGPEPSVRRDLSDARAAYAAYLAREAELKPHREYAEMIARATHGGGQTPVYPLARMGTGGGPLLCDHCGKPMVLEGGKHHKVPVDVAFDREECPQPNWVSWIYGGMVVDVETNGTLRIYHGHLNRDPKECSTKGKEQIERAEREFVETVPAGIAGRLDELLAAERPDLGERDRMRLINDVISAAFRFDPGTGRNRPGPV